MKVSIVTVVYNNKDFISKAIESLNKQTYRPIEHVLIDGGSNDGTQEMIRPYLNKIDYFISEKDSGIYNALNKGISKCTGDVIGILHADDFYPTNDVISEVIDAFNSNETDIVYGVGQFVDRERPNLIRRRYGSKPFKKYFLYYGWIPLHTTMFVKRDIYEKFGLYDEKYKISSDYEASLRWFTNSKITTFYLDKILIHMRLGGASTRLYLQFYKSYEDLQVIRRYGLMSIFTLFAKITRKIPQYIQRFKFVK